MYPKGMIYLFSDTDSNFFFFLSSSTYEQFQIVIEMHTQN